MVLVLGLVEVVLGLVEMVLDREMGLEAMDKGQNKSIFCRELVQLQSKKGSKGAIQETYIELCCTQRRDPEATSPHKSCIP